MGILLALSLVCVPDANACKDTSVARAMFKGARDVHPLYVIADRTDPSGDEISQRLKAWLKGPGTDLNLRVERVFADDPEIRWQTYGMKSRPPELPVVVLVTRHAGHLGAKVVDRWQPAPDEEDLAVLLRSPLRESIREKAPYNMALLIYSPGTEKGSGNSEKQLRKTARKWLDQRAGEKKGKRKKNITVLRLNRGDPRERTLVSFAEIPASGPDWVGVLAGPAKMIIPPMLGNQITEKNLLAHLNQLAGKCTCRADVRGMGVDIPMQWGKGDTARVSSRKPAPGNGGMCQGKGPGETKQDSAAGQCPPGTIGLSPLGASILGLMALVAVVVMGVAAGRRKSGNPDRRRDDENP